MKSGKTRIYGVRPPVAFTVKRKIYCRDRRPRRSKKTNAYHRIKPLYVILSGARSAKSNFRRVNNGAKARGIFAEAGYGLKSRWLFVVNVTFAETSHPNSEPYPFVALLLGFVSDRRRKAAHSLNKTSTPKTACGFLRSE